MAAMESTESVDHIIPGSVGAGLGRQHTLAKNLTKACLRIFYVAQKMNFPFLGGGLWGGGG
jgi:ribulose 1,5-bisphosphate synthetase/thiazole synthase